MSSLSGNAMGLVKRFCRTGDAWGLLEGRPWPVLFTWWCFRHAVYFSLVFLLFYFGVKNWFVPFSLRSLSLGA
jgi:hypothetical protein